MNAEELGGRLLASVSRSFYLSIRVLPAQLRAPIGLAYLLARASDTIADSATSSSESRIAHLANFGAMINDGSRDSLADLQREIQPPDQSERELIARLDEVFAWLDAMDSPAKAEIQRVLEPIIRGQKLDLQRFHSISTNSIIALQAADELEEYTYLVAGCVGEFWTRISIQRLGDRYSRIDPEALCKLGREFGKALQFVNILRDLPSDLRGGRCYLPEEELRAAGVTPAELLSDPTKARALVDRWISRAESLLASGRDYISAIRPARVRAACFLPWIIGKETLRLLKERPSLETAQRVKVPRSFVYRSLLRSLAVGFTDAALPARK